MFPALYFPAPCFPGSYWPRAGLIVNGPPEAVFSLGARDFVFARRDRGDTFSIAARGSTFVPERRGDTFPVPFRGTVFIVLEL